MRESDSAEAVAQLVAAIGSPRFGARFHAAMAVLSGSQLCSAFAFDRAGPPHVLLAEGWLPAVPAFAQMASAEYAREYWRRDAVGRRLSNRHAHGAVEIFRVTAGGIMDAEHRRDCYERAHVAERLSLCEAGAPALLASAYRTVDAGPFTVTDLDRVERFAPLLMSALRRHVELKTAPAAGGADPVTLLLAAGERLTAREAQVAAALARGMQQAEIAAEIGIALSSIITYRRRAYRKLGVGDRRQLRQFVEGLMR